MNYSKAHIRESLEPAACAPSDDMPWLTGMTPEIKARLMAALPAARVAAAVLVPLVERDAGLAVLLTERAATLKDHAGQISFPGGRIEPDDCDAWRAALREAREEIGLEPQQVEFGGYLPDQLVSSGFRVTPIVGFVRPDYSLHLDAAEVHDAFEVPLDFLCDPANHRPRLREVGGVSLQMYDIVYGRRTIWGATAGMVLNLCRLARGRVSKCG